MLRFWLIRQSRIPFSIHTLLFFSLFVGITRGVLEYVLFGIEARATDIIAFVPFYLSLPFLYALALGIIPGLHYNKILQPVTFATLLGITPPIFDFLIGTAETHSVFYGYFITKEYSEFPWLGYNPARNYPLGEALAIWLTFVLAIIYTRSVTRSVWKSLLALFSGYVVYIIYSLCIPAIAIWLLFGNLPTKSDLATKSFAERQQIVYIIALVQIFVAWAIDAIKTGVIRHYVNRFLHVAPFMAGTLLGTLQAKANLRDAIMAVLVTLTTGLVVTAHNDLQYGILPNMKDHRYRHGMLSNFFAMASYIMILFAGYKFALLGIACFALSVLYHFPFYNARNTALGSMKIEGFWGLFSYLTGAMSGTVIFPDQLIIAFSGLIWGGFSLFSVIKDAKDVRVDFRAGRSTLYTWWYKQGYSLRYLQISLAISICSLLIVSGVGYYSSPSLKILHIILSLFTAWFALKSTRRTWFYLFLGNIVNHFIMLMVTHA